MKRQLINLISGGLVSILSAYGSFAQEGNLKELPAIAITASANVSAKVNRVFNQYFKNASHLRWYEIEKKLLVTFIMNDQENRALFTRSGQLVYLISYGTEAHLPADIRHLIKSNYYDQSITRVFKVNQENRNIWVISMEDAKQYIWARVEDMELQETKRMKKLN